MTRLNKWLSEIGKASRREAERWIVEGRLSVNGRLVKDLGHKIQPYQDQVTLDGKLIAVKAPPRVYWVFNKPVGVLTSRSDPQGRPTIYNVSSLRRAQLSVSTVGRLDLMTEGLLILSNDGEFVHRLTHPKFKVPRVYRVLLDRVVDLEKEKTLRRGVKLEDGWVRNIELRRLGGRRMGKAKGHWYDMTLYEGRNRIVRRIFDALGHRVKRLVRVGYGDIRLPHDLPTGEYLPLAPNVLKKLRRSVDLT